MLSLDLFCMVMALLFNAGTMLSQNRRKMILLNVLTITIWAIPIFLQGSTAAISVVIIAMTASLFQVAIPDRLLQKTRLLRSGIAVAAAILAVAISYETTKDILPLMALIIARMSELQSDARRIRMGYLFGMTCWTSYFIAEGMMLMVFVELAMILTAIYAIAKTERERRYIRASEKMIV